MKIAKYVLPVIAAGFVASSASAAISANNTVSTLAAGITSNTWTVDTDTDFLSAVLYVNLTAGAVFDPFVPAGNLTLDGDSLFVSVGDTFFTANGNGSTGIAGGAGDIEPTAPAAETVDPQLIGVAWFSPGSDSNDIGNGLPIGRFSFTDDAAGEWRLLVINAADDQTLLTGVVEGGAMVPEPASLALMGLGGLVALRRRR